MTTVTGIVNPYCYIIAGEERIGLIKRKPQHIIGRMIQFFLGITACSISVINLMISPVIEKLQSTGCTGIRIG